MVYIVDLNTSGQSWMSLDMSEPPADSLRISSYWRPMKTTWDLPEVYKGNGTNVSYRSLYQRNVIDRLNSGEILL